MSAAPTITLTPELTEDLIELHQAQEIINAVTDVTGIEDEMGEMFEEQLARCSEIIDSLMDLMDHIRPPHRNGDLP